MTRVQEIIAGQLMALAPDQARGALAMELPTGQQAWPAVDVTTMHDQGRPVLMTPGAGAAQQPAASLEDRRYSLAGGVATVPVRGVLTPNSEILERWLGWTTYQGLEQTCAALAADSDVRAAVLHLDSPGGMVLGLEAGAQAVAALAAIKPVHAIVHPLAASAAYWIACQATDIAMTPGAAAGSIGTVVMAYRPEVPDRAGDRWFEFTSAHARAKRPDPGTEAGAAELRRDLDELEAGFHAAVSAGRGIPLAELPARLSVTDDPADGGAIFWGGEAVTRGLADTIEAAADFWQRIHATYAAPAKAARVRMGRGRAAQARAAQAQSAS